MNNFNLYLSQYNIAKITVCCHVSRLLCFWVGCLLYACIFCMFSCDDLSAGVWVMVRCALLCWTFVLCFAVYMCFR
jgi:hypothetical protein